MKNFLVFGTMLFVMTLLIGGAYYPESFIMNFADASTTQTILRTAIIMTLIGVLVSKPPRSIAFRVVLGAMSTIVQVVTLVGMMDYQISILDALVYLEVSIIFAIEALEYHPKRTKVRRSLGSTASTTA